MLADGSLDSTLVPGGSPDGARIVIDALAARFGGTAYASVHLSRQLALRSDVAEVTVVARRGSIVERGLLTEPGVRCVTLPSAGRAELARRVAWQACCLPRALARESCDVLISMSGILPRAPGCRVVCLLFNPVMYEEPTPANFLRRWAVRRTAGEAVCLAAPSRLMADLVSASTRRECAVIPLGVDHDLFTSPPEPGTEILCVGDFYAHKRHDLIVDAWLRLSSPRPRLRFVGNPSVDTDAHARLLTRIRALPESDAITLEYRVPLRRLIAAYHRARVFVIASEHESFCMPLVESMACGVPPVVRGLQSLRETGGAGATYVDGDDPARWAIALAQLLDDDAAHRRARDLAKRAGAGFSWERLAADLAHRIL